jgi:hypothetical protein
MIKRSRAMTMCFRDVMPMLKASVVGFLPALGFDASDKACEAASEAARIHIRAPFVRCLDQSDQRKFTSPMLCLGR